LKVVENQENFTKRSNNNFSVSDLIRIHLYFL
jgi:hypothetical protein